MATKRLLKGLRGKVQRIFCELAGERAQNVDGRYTPEVITRIERSLRRQRGRRRAHLIAFHMSDWSHDAAFVVAVHLFPERFAASEVREGVDQLLIHVPAHVRAAALLAGWGLGTRFDEERALRPGSRRARKTKAVARKTRKA